MVKYSEMHYKGFIDACENYGIEKTAADRLYKEAFLGTALKSLWNIGRAAMKSKALQNTVKQGLKGVGQSSKDIARTAGTRAVANASGASSLGRLASRLGGAMGGMRTGMANGGGFRGAWQGM